MKIKALLFILLFVCMLSSFAQSLPDNMIFDAENHQVTLSGSITDGFYDETTLESINIDFYDSNYWNQLAANYGTDNYIPAKLTYGDVIIDSIGVKFKGNTSYTKAQQTGTKRLSFGLKLNEYIKGGDIDGYNTLNLNNAYEDASYMKEVVYGHLARKHIPAVRGNFIKLYINQEYWGVYPNIQQINGDFLKEWFLNNDGILWRANTETTDKSTTIERPGGGGGGGANWGDGTTALNYLGDDTTKYQQYYTLKSTDYENSWEYLVRVCDILNNTPSDDLYSTLSEFMNIDATLWFLATEIIFSDDDSYVMKGKQDFYLYFDDETQLMQPIEFDGNSAMANKNTNWKLFYNEEKENYPLMNLLFQIPELRQRYLAHVRTILNDAFNTTYSHNLIDNYASLIQESVQLDTQTPYSYQEHLTSIDDLKQFITERKTFLYTDPELNRQVPIITNVSCQSSEGTWASPYNNDEVTFSLKAEHNRGIKEVNLFISNQLFGNFTKHQMTATGDTYTITLNEFNESQYARFYFEAIANNNANTAGYEPSGAEHHTYYLEIQTPNTESDITINELMATNENSQQDEHGDYDDWIELYNNSNSTIDLSGYYLTDKTDNLTKYEIPEGTTIEGNSYLTIWADEDGSQNGLHANFKLSSEGETVTLLTPDVQIADQTEFIESLTDQSFARVPNGIGEFEWQHPTFGFNNETELGIDDKTDSTADEVTFYPNPATDIIYVNCVEQSQLTFINSMGQKVKTIQIEYSGSQKINISALQKGIYFIEIESTNNRSIHKVVKQ